MKQREYRILELLTERKRIEVAALAREIGPRLLEKVRLCAPSGERSTARDGTMMGGSRYLTDRSIRELRL